MTSKRCLLLLRRHSGLGLRVCDVCMLKHLESSYDLSILPLPWTLFFAPLKIFKVNKEDWLLLGGGFKDFLFSPLLGEMIQFDDHIFEMGWFNHQLVCVFGEKVNSDRWCPNRERARIWSELTHRVSVSKHIFKKRSDFFCSPCFLKGKNVKGRKKKTLYISVGLFFPWMVLAW